MCKPENLPDFARRVIVVKRQDRTKTLRLQLMLSDGSWHTEMTSHWPAGSPTPADLEAVTASVVASLVDALVTTYGVQGVLS